MSGSDDTRSTAETVGVSLPIEPATTTIYKILTNNEWCEFQHSGMFTGNPLDLQDGYIHMSYSEQVQKTYQKFFQNKIDNVVVVHVNALLLNPNELRPEANKPGGDIYPHIYGTIPLSAVLKTTDMF
jgi:uncharacterized protein (DUF952 family)